MKKKIISIILSFIIILLLEVTLVFADEAISTENERIAFGANGEVVIRNDELILPDLSAEAQLERLEEQGVSQEQIREARYKLTSEYPDPPTLSSRSVNATWMYHNPLITFYRQEESNYCVHACTQMTLKYFGQVVEQGDLDNSILLPTSTGGSHIIYAATNVLNPRNLGTTYVFREGLQVTQTTMENHLYSSINTYEAPAIIGIKISNNTWEAYQELPNAVSSHALVVSGIKSDKSGLQVVDPISGFGASFSSVSQRYSVSSDVVYDAMSYEDMGYIY